MRSRLRPTSWIATLSVVLTACSQEQPIDTPAQDSNVQPGTNPPSNESTDHRNTTAGATSSQGDSGESIPDASVGAHESGAGGASTASPEARGGSEAGSRPGTRDDSAGAPPALPDETTGGDETDGGDVQSPPLDADDAGTPPTLPGTLLALNGPSSLAPGGVAIIDLPKEALQHLASITLAGVDVALDDGRQVQFVLVSAALDYPTSNTAPPVDPASLDLSLLSLDRAALTSLPANVLPLLRVAIRAPLSVPVGHGNFELTTLAGTTYRWPVEILDDLGPFVPPSPDGIVWPAISNHQGVFPIGTQGPYHPLVDPIFVPAYPRPETPLGVTYDIRLRTLAGEQCLRSAATRGLVVGEERVDGIGTNPIDGFYDIENGNFVELAIDRTPIGGRREIYRGGWVTAALDALQDPAARGQLPPPAPGHSLLTLRSLRTGLPLVVNYLATSTSIEEACPELSAPDDPMDAGTP